MKLTPEFARKVNDIYYNHKCRLLRRDINMQAPKTQEEAIKYKQGRGVPGAQTQTSNKKPPKCPMGW